MNARTFGRSGLRSTPDSSAPERAPVGTSGEGGDVIVVDRLAKTFSLGFRRKRVEAVRDVSFRVRRGEIFGLVGPNGAGKTTTIKAMMGLIAPSAGRIEILGEPVPTVASRRRVGYLPETSHYYEYLTAEEALHFYGRLYRVPAAVRTRRVAQLLARVGLGEARGKRLRKFSKGMLQRLGLAQALIADPDIVVLDEPQSGLDPLGRKDVADLIRELKEQGKTVFFSSHILPDVERVCDRVAVLVAGRITDIGPLETLLDPRTLQTEVAIGHAPEPLLAQLGAELVGLEVLRHHTGNTLMLGGDADVQRALRLLVDAGVVIESVSPRRESLEDVFVRQATGGSRAGSATAAAGDDRSLSGAPGSGEAEGDGETAATEASDAG